MRVSQAIAHRIYDIKKGIRKQTRTTNKHPEIIEEARKRIMRELDEESNSNK